MSFTLTEINNQNVTKANATRDSAYKIHTNKYIEHHPSKPITTSMREKGTDKYKNAHMYTSGHLRGQERSLRLRFEVLHYTDVTNKC